MWEDTTCLITATGGRVGLTSGLKLNKNMVIKNTLHMKQLNLIQFAQIEQQVWNTLYRFGLVEEPSPVGGGAIDSNGTQKTLTNHR